MKFTSALVLGSATFASLVAALPASTSQVDPAVQEAVEAEGTPLYNSAVAVTTTENGLSGACKDVTLIFARGTNEAGNVGERAGPPVFTVLRSSGYLGDARLAVQGVDYSATVGGYLLGGDPTGSAKMLDLINQAATKCPNTKIVIGGYSQGAQLTHNAAKKLSASVTARIAAAFVFGDPFNGQAVGSVPSSKVISICHDGDIICTGSGGSAQHLNYDQDAGKVAQYIVAHV
jgi:cutinase